MQSENDKVLVHIQRLHENAIVPEYKTAGAAGFDLSSCYHYEMPSGFSVLVRTGWAFEIPEGYELQVRPRSGLSLIGNLRVSLGTVDSDYRGEVSAIVQNTGTETAYIPYGFRIAQAVLNKVPRASLVVTKTLSDTDRGTDGYGSTGV